MSAFVQYLRQNGQNGSTFVSRSSFRDEVEICPLPLSYSLAALTPEPTSGRGGERRAASKMPIEIRACLPSHLVKSGIIIISALTASVRSRPSVGSVDSDMRRLREARPLSTSKRISALLHFRRNSSDDDVCTGLPFPIFSSLPNLIC